LNDSIQIRGARVHNLKDISLDIPHERLTVVTGVSGSGKSSLAFDTIYAEGQRRYVESLSAYARQLSEEHHAESSFDGGHLHRTVRFSAPAVGPRGPDVLP
jgi:excinuclease UvrABC ATPase subunit